MLSRETRSTAYLCGENMKARLLDESHSDEHRIETCFSCSEDDDPDVHQHRVTDVTFKTMYSPHRITTFIITLLWIGYCLWKNLNSKTLGDQYFYGFICVSGVVIILGCLLFPNGPFVRPHPIVWRIVIGLSICYLSLIIFCMFQSYETVKEIIYYLDPLLRENKPDNKNYAADCRFLWETIQPQLDAFCLLHFFGWAGKVFIIRHSGLLWLFSIMWEMTEVFFQHLLPNFKECWWDVILLDILLCNGLGIVLGQKILDYLEYKEFHWESVKCIKGAKGKIRRVILQFIPMKVDPSNWLSTNSTFKRVLNLTFFSIMWQVSELNTFFLKHVYVIYTKHWINMVRCILIMLLALPGTRQFYEFITNPRVKTFGIFTWVFLIITICELVLGILHGVDLFRKTKYDLVVYWFVTQLILTFIVMFLAVAWKNKIFGSKVKTATKQKQN